MLGEVDLRDWAEDGDLVRAEIRLLPIVKRFASEPEAVQKILGEELSRRLREFNQGGDVKGDALRGLLADLLAVNRSPPVDAAIGSPQPEAENAISPPAKTEIDPVSSHAEATIDRIPGVDWSN